MLPVSYRPSPMDRELNVWEKGLPVSMQKATISRYFDFTRDTLIFFVVTPKKVYIMVLRLLSEQKHSGFTLCQRSEMSSGFVLCSASLINI